MSASNNKAYSTEKITDHTSNDCILSSNNRAFLVSSSLFFRNILNELSIGKPRLSPIPSLRNSLLVSINYYTSIFIINTLIDFLPFRNLLTRGWLGKDIYVGLRSSTVNFSFCGGSIKLLSSKYKYCSISIAILLSHLSLWLSIVVEKPS